VSRWLLPLAGILLLLGIWELYVTISGVSSLVLPSPVDVVSALVNDRGTLWHNLKPTALEICLGIAMGGAFGLLAALALHLSATVRRASYAVLIGSQAIPIPILAPLLVVWLGFGLLPKLIVIGLVSFFPILVTSLAALESVDPDLIKLLRTFDAGRMQALRFVELPSALPGVLAGAKVAAVFAVIAAILGEQAGCSSGLGCLLTVTVSNLETAEAFATVFVLAAFAILVFALLTLVERRALPWVHRQRDIQSPR
jgi:ABC-type nitrate/sulfonate/bicarbonate transport system permease component